MIWREFQEAAPEMAQLGLERFERTGVALIGTICRDGSPRISPVEPVIAYDHLLLGMMWRSKKAMDLLRDPRCVIHSAITRLEGTEGEFKLRGRVVQIQEERYHQLFHEKWGTQPPTRFHIFSVEIESASFIAYDIGRGEMLVKRWNPQLGLMEIRRKYP